MTLRSSNTFRIALALCCALTVLPAAAQDMEGWNIDRFTWSGPLAEHRTVEAINEHGDIRVRSGGEGPVEVLALIQKQDVDPYTAEVVIGEAEGRLKVEVVYQLTAGADPDGQLMETVKRRVDVTVLLPEGTSLQAKTVRGLLEAKGLTGAAVVETLSGNITLSTGGDRVEARTDRGEMLVLLRATEWSQPPVLESVRGDITVWFPPEGNADVEVKTSGEITTDYSIDIERLGTGQRKRGAAEIGKDGLGISITSTLGKIKLMRSHV